MFSILFICVMFIARCVLFSHAQIECTSYGLRWLQCGCPETHIAIFLIESLSGNRLNLVHTIRLCPATRFVLSVPGDACKYWSSVTLIMHEPNHYFISVERRMLEHTHTHRSNSIDAQEHRCLFNKPFSFTFWDTKLLHFNQKRSIPWALMLRDHHRFCGQPDK